MAQTTVSETTNSIALEIDYSKAGSMAVGCGVFFLALFYLLFSAIDSTGAGANVSGLEYPFYMFTTISGVVLFGGGLLALGTMQKLSYNIALEKIEYSSTVAFLKGGKASYSTKDLHMIDYHLKMIHVSRAKHMANSNVRYSDEGTKVFERWENSISLWYRSGDNVDLPSIPHSDELEKVLQLFSHKTGAVYKKVFVDDRDEE